MDSIMSQCPRTKLKGSQVGEAESVYRSNTFDYLESIFMKLWAFTIILPRSSIHRKCVRLISVPILALILLRYLLLSDYGSEHRGLDRQWFASYPGSYPLIDRDIHSEGG
jgi:hypothetical protein